MKYFQFNNLHIVINTPAIWFGWIIKIKCFGYIGFKIGKDFKITVANRRG